MINSENNTDIKTIINNEDIICNKYYIESMKEII